MYDPEAEYMNREELRREAQHQRRVRSRGCADGMCGARDCNTCAPGWWMHEEKEEEGEE